MLRPVVLAVALLATAGVAAATKVQITQSESVLTLRVDGELTIDPEGRVRDYRIRTELEPRIREMVAKAVAGWRFRPIALDGRPVAATSPMRITLAAAETQGGYEVRVDNVVFRSNTVEEHEAAEAARKQRYEQGSRIGLAGEPASPLEQPVAISSGRMTPPGYPKGLLMSGVEGVVLLNLRLHPDGRVAEVFASQSSLLNVKGRSELLDRARALLERNAAAAAAKWTFKVEAKDVAALKPADLTVRVPVEYVLSPGAARDGSLTGKWRQEFRGPSFPVPWLLGTEDDQVVGVSDLDGGEVLAGHSEFRLSDRSVIGATL